MRSKIKIIITFNFQTISFKISNIFNYTEGINRHLKVNFYNYTVIRLKNNLQ